MEEKIKTTPAGEPLWANYIHRKGAALGLPISGNFELTSNCNFNCKMCYVHGDARKDVMSAEDWIELGRAARDAGMVFVLLTGGEPLTRKDFKKIYTALIEMGLLVSINTNASLIDDDMFEFLVKHPPLRMNISLYACSNEVYTELCGKSACDVVKHNIRRLHDAGIGVKINASITPYNASEIEGIYDFGKEVGVPVQATTYMYPPVRVDESFYGRSPARFEAEEAALQMLRCREQYLSPEQLRRSASAIMPDEENCGSDVSEGMRCRAGRTSFWVTWDGRMLPCGMFPHQGYSVREIGFEGAWNEVKNFTSKILMPKECTNCPKKERCSVCAASCFAETGRSDVCPEYICRLTKTYDSLLNEKYRELE